MAENKVRIADVAEELGLSTATVSNVLHGKTHKMSEATIKRVEQKLEETGYIPNMAGILLAQNNSRIIGVVVNDGEKYEGRVLEDGFVMASLNALSREVNRKGYFLMVKTTADIREIPAFASMWNMDGLILMGFCGADYETLRAHTRISFVVYDGYLEDTPGIVNLVIDHYDGGYQAALCLADNEICMDKERMDGFAAAFASGEVIRWKIPMLAKERRSFYEEREEWLKRSGITAVFAVSDYYALDFMRFVQEKGWKVPEDIQVIGFDDNAASRESIPMLTTIHQEAALRAEKAIACIEAMRDRIACENRIVLPVEMIVRESTREMPCHNL